MRLPIALFLSCLATVEPVDAWRPQTPPCPRQPGRSLPSGTVIEIRDRNPPCRIEFRDTGIRLEAAADGSRPDPGRTVIRAHDDETGVQEIRIHGIRDTG